MRRPDVSRLLPLVLLLLAPALLLHRALFLGEQYIPFDLTTFPPWSVSLTPEEIAARRAGGNYDITEKTLLCAPEYRLAAEEIQNGRFPHWDPYVRAGAPLFANALDGFSYPAHWPFFFLTVEGGAGLVAWIAFCIAGLLMFGFLRSLNSTRAAALFGALAFQFSGTLAANAHFFMRMETLTWTPGLFWALHALSRRRGVARIPAFAGLAAATALTWLAGFPPYAFAVTLSAALFAGVLVVTTWRRGGPRAAFAFGGWALAGATVGLLAAAVQLFPMLDYFPHSQRRLDQDPAALAAQGLETFGFLGFLMPSPFGDGASSAALPYERNPLLYLCSALSSARGEPIPPNYNGTEYALYPGALTLLALLLALLRPKQRFRAPALVLALLFCALATGGLLFQGAAALLPPLRSMPPIRLAAPVTFFVAALAGLGLDTGATELSAGRRRSLAVLAVLFPALLLGLGSFALHAAKEPPAWILEHIHARWQAAPAQPSLAEVQSFLGSYLGPALQRLAHQSLRAALFFALGALLLLVALRGRLLAHGPRRRGSLLFKATWTGVALIDLLSAALPWNPSFPPRLLHETPVHTFLRRKVLETRQSGGFAVARVARTARLPTAFPPDLLLPLGVRDLNAYAFLDRSSHRPFLALYGEGQMIRRYWLKAFPADERLRRGLFDLLGVRYLLSDEEIPELGKPAIPPLEGPGGGFYVYERPSALPRAFLTLRAEEIPDDETAVRRLIDADFDPRAVALLGPAYGPDGLPLAGAGPSPHGGRTGAPAGPGGATGEAEGATVEFTRVEPSRLHLIVRRSPGAWLVLADTAMPHWLCFLDGRAVPWRRADLFLRAVWIPPGDHEIRWLYDPVPFRVGLWLSGAAAAFVLLMLLHWNGRRAALAAAGAAGTPPLP